MREIRWGVLGAAGIARAAVVPAIQASRNGHVHALATRNPDAALAWTKTAGIDKVAGSYEALLADPEIDAVYIPLPNSLHLPWVEAAARAGKSILCEKPLGLNAEEARKAVSACRSAGVHLMEGFMYRFHPQHGRVKSIIAEGGIGEVVSLHAHLSVNLMSPIDPQNVRFRKELGGGALLDMGCYTVNIARMIFDAEPTAVIAKWTVDEQTGVDVATSALLDFGRGRSAVASCSFRGNGQGFYRVIGTSWPDRCAPWNHSGARRPGRRSPCHTGRRPGYPPRRDARAARPISFDGRGLR